MGESTDPRTQLVVADVTQADQVRRAMDQASRTSGAVTILVNNVGGVETVPFARTTPDVLQRMVDVNLMSAFHCCREVVPGMIEAGAGRVINIASTAGIRAYPYVSAYVAAKHALVGLTRSLAMETEGKGVAVNAVCPGFADTDMTTRSAEAVAKRTGRSMEEIKASYAQSNPHGRLVRPDEVAERVAWLCLPAQAAVTGQILIVDGSETMEDAS